MRIFKRYYHTMIYKKIINIKPETDFIKLKMIEYLPTFDYIYQPLSLQEPEPKLLIAHG